MNIQQATEWVMERRNFHHGLDHFARFMEMMGNPQDRFESIHVAGTNGKGSTVSYLARCLEEAGYRTGTFTSPHLVKHQDRIRINRQWISDEAFIRYLQQYRSVLEEWDLAMFEIDFFFACLWFIEQKVDIAVIEVGLGGLLDSTNTLSHPLCSVIVSIGMDHMERLGNTPALIAEQKGGIIKEKGLTVIGRMDRECLEVFEKICRSRNSQLICTDDPEICDLKPIEFIGCGLKIQLQSYARYQAYNASVALTVLDTLRKKGLICITDDQIRNGFAQAEWAGRFEVMGKDPLVILDGAHNAPGIEALCQTLPSLPRPCVVVFTALKDKETEIMAHQCHDHCDEMIITQFDYYRAQTGEKLKIQDSLLVENWKEAIETAMKHATEQGSVVVTGSLYFISQARKWILEQN